MKKTLIASLVAASLVGAAGVAAAGDMSGFAGKDSGAYVGANVGYGYSNWKTEDFGSGYSVKDKGGFAWGLNVGYMFNTNLGVELDYDFLTATKVKDSSGTEVAKIKNQYYPGLYAVFNFPIAQQWNLFAKLGMNYLTPKIDYTTASGTGDVKTKVWAPGVVLGASYDIMKNLALNAQVKYILENKNVETRDGVAQTALGAGVTTPSYLLTTVGVNYKF